MPRRSRPAPPGKMQQMDFHHPTGSPGPDYDWESHSGTRWFYKWVLGLAVPLLLLGYGVSVVLTREATFYGNRQPMPLHGLNAVVYGVVILSAALLLHCRFFWENVYSGAWWAELGKIIGLFGLIAGLGTLLLRAGVYGIN